MYMDDIKLFAKNERELETQIKTIRIYSQDIGIEFRIEKCAVLIMKSGKRQMTEEIELLNQERIRTLGEKENYEYLEILETDTIKHVEMKEKITRVSQTNKKVSWNEALLQESHPRDKHLDFLPCNILWIMLVMDEESNKRTWG